MLLATLLFCAAPQVAAPDHDALVAQARALLPVYDGDHKDFLSPDERRGVEAAAHLFSAALALEPDSAYALWWRGRAEVLLGEDSNNRGHLEAGEAHYRDALASFDRGLELAPDYYWGHYARGMARYNLREFASAVEDYERAIELTNARIDAHGRDGAGDAAFVRFKARNWRADARLHLGQFERAREEFVAFYADNGNNQWDLGFALGEAHLRERDFGAAHALYTELLGKEDYFNYEGIHSQLGYLCGLVDGREGEVAGHLTNAMAYEFTPTMYPRLWLWILSEGEAREKAAADLREFLDHPPKSLSAWDGTLGRYVLDGGSSTDFLAAADAELERREAEGVQLDALPCEVRFYAGLRLEEDAALAPDGDTRRSLQLEALDFHRRALAFRPRAFKWEWAYARRRFARLAVELGLEAKPPEVFGDEGLARFGEGGLVRTAAGVQTLERVRTHVPGAAAPVVGWGLSREGAATPGALVRADWSDAYGRARSLLRVVDVRDE